MTKLSINLIRHGEKRLFVPDPGLTELGQEQAEKLAQKLFNKQKATSEQQALHLRTIILSSPKRRTQETAAIVAKQLKLDVQVDDFLNIDNELPINSTSKNKILTHFQSYLKSIKSDSVDILEIFAVTHSQEVRNFWQILGGPDEAIEDIYECGVWTMVVDRKKNIVNGEKNLFDGQKLDFMWTEGELNP